MPAPPGAADYLPPVLHALAAPVVEDDCPAAVWEPACM